MITSSADLSITLEIYKYLVEKYTLTNGIFTSGKVSMVQFNVKRMSRLINLTMRQVPNLLPNMLIVAISRNGKIIIPHGDTIVEDHDTLYLIGEKNEITELHNRVYERGKYTNLQKVMIAGGGRDLYCCQATLRIRHCRQDHRKGQGSLLLSLHASG